MTCFRDGTPIFEANTAVWKPPYWDDLRVPLSATNAGPVNAPSFAKFIDDGAGSTGVHTYLFDQNTEEEVFFVAQMPHKWLEGSTIYPHIHWFPTDNTAGFVRWGLEFTKARPFTVMPSTQLFSVQALAGGTALTHQIDSFGPLVMTGDTISTMFMCRLFREAAHAGDTYAADAGGLEVDFHYQLDTPGSKQEFIK